MLAYCLMMAACASLTGADWEARIGRFSLEETIQILGVPENCADLDDGGTACSWTMSRGADWLDKLVLTFDAKGRLATADKIHF